MKLTINEVVDKFPAKTFIRKKDGKGYKAGETGYIFTGLVEATIDGVDKSGVRITCFDRNLWGTLKPGESYFATLGDTYKGVTPYVINPLRDDKEIVFPHEDEEVVDDHRSYKAKNEPTQGEAPEKAAYTPKPAYKTDNPMQVASFARSYAKDIVVAICGRSGDLLDEARVCRLLDQLSNANLHWMLTFGKDGTTSDTIVRYLLAKNGLTEGVEILKMEPKKLLKDLVDSNFDEATFVGKVKAYINGDDLPI